MKISAVVPVFNEEENLQQVYSEIKEVFGTISPDAEIIFIDDGSSDASYDLLTKIASADNSVRLIKFSRNYGQTAALQAGFDHASGNIIVTLDADLQNDPKSIPEMIKALNDNEVDVVSGWRYKRQDAFFRSFVSTIANKIISFISGLRLHDYGCTLKVYRVSQIKTLKLYGEMHRFIPAFINWNGGKVMEIKVSHRPRIHGSSSYGMERIHRVFLDLITTKFLTTYSSKPIHIFGSFGLLSILGGIMSFFYVVVRKLYLSGEWISPLFFISVMLIGMGVILILMGIIAEIAVRIYFSQEGHQPYKIAENKQ